MIIYNKDVLEMYMEKDFYFLKAILNENGISFFDKKTQHRDHKITGLSYEDEYKGNALAVIVKEKRIEIRLHKEFSDKRVANIVYLVTVKLPELLNHIFYYGSKVVK